MQQKHKGHNVFGVVTPLLAIMAALDALLILLFGLGSAVNAAPLTPTAAVVTGPTPTIAVSNSLFLPAVMSASKVIACVSPLTSFEEGVICWSHKPNAIMQLKQTQQQAHQGVNAMELVVDLRAVADRNYGEAIGEFPQAQNFSGQVLSAWISTTQGARGNNKEKPNGIHLFVEDTKGRKLYGTWHNLIEEGWFQIMLPLTNSAPACGSMEAQFDPTAIKKIGINFGMGEGAGAAAEFAGSILVDSITVTAGLPALPASDHFYDFEDPNAQQQIPHWDIDQGWGAGGLDRVYWDNGSLAAQARFDLGNDSTRKGFVNIIYSPYLNLAHKDHRMISVDIRFAPTAVNPITGNCPIVASLWVYDGVKEQWFTSDYQHIGTAASSRVTFNLDNLGEYSADSPKEQPTLTDIRRVGIQLYANVAYTGTVFFDNIVVGGREVPNQYANLNMGFAQTVTTTFVLNDKPIRFVGFNIEYLYFLREAEIEKLLNEVQRLPEPRVIRIWGFGEGCENQEATCVAYSKRLQPERGRWNESALEVFDRVVAMAGARGIRVIVSLANNWHEYGGRPKYVEWLQKEFPAEAVISPTIPPGSEAYTATLEDLFYTNAHTRQWYKDHVAKLLLRPSHITGKSLVSETTLFSIELGNEFRVRSDVSGRKLHDWVAEMSAYVDSLAPNHIIGVGLEGWYIKPITETEQFKDWQTFPKNLWHYGNNQRKDCSQEFNYGSNGTDFVSLHSSQETTVMYQVYADDEHGNQCRSPVLSEKRVGLPFIDYTNMHLYIAAKESNLYRAPYCDWGFSSHLCNDEYNLAKFQAGEWLLQHVRDSQKLGKPILVGEVGLRLTATQTITATAVFTPAFNLEERQQLYRRYLQEMQQMGVNGVLIWNLSDGSYLAEPSLTIKPGESTFAAILEEAQRWQEAAQSPSPLTLALAPR